MICGGPGSDIVVAGRGDDTVFTGAGNDLVYGESGADVIDAGAGDDAVYAGRGDDVVDGGRGFDACDDGEKRRRCELVSFDGDPEPVAVGDVEITSQTRVYDGLGSLVEVDIDGAATGFVWDHSLAVPQVVEMTDGSGAADVLYGLTRLAELSDTATSVAGYSVLGDSFDLGVGFDPFGSALTDPVDAIGFGFRGELHLDGQVHLRARDLLPELGRFTTIDPLDGVAGTVVESNPYHYVNNDPVNLLDPLGLAPDQGRSAFSDSTFAEAWIGASLENTCLFPTGCLSPTSTDERDMIYAPDVRGPGYIVVLDSLGQRRSNSDWAWDPFALGYVPTFRFGVIGTTETARSAAVEYRGLLISVNADPASGLQTFGDAWNVVVSFSWVERRRVTGFLADPNTGAIASYETGIRPFEIVGKTRYEDLSLDAIEIVDRVRWGRGDRLRLPIGTAVTPQWHATPSWGIVDVYPPEEGPF